MTIDTVVFVPGICGSVLSLGDREIWPGNAWQASVAPYPDEAVRLLRESPDLRPTDVLRTVRLTLGPLTLHHFDGYQRAIDELEGMDFKEANGTLVAWPYDWRCDIAGSARRLHDMLEKREASPSGAVYAIVAHSMGGLVARYMLECIGIPKNVDIKLCALVATPHLGAPAVLQNILGKRPEIFLSARQCKDVLRGEGYPSAYQLLPHKGVPALLKASNASGFTIEDPFIKPGVATQLELVASSLAAAGAFGQALPPIGPGFEPPCSYVAIVGTDQNTIGANYLETGPDATPVKEQTGGDGTVPLWSAAPPGIPVRCVAATHGGMFRASDTIAMLRAVLRPGAVGGRLFSIEEGPTAATISAQAVDDTVEIDGTATVSVIADRKVSKIDATLEVEMITGQGQSTGWKQAIKYEGGPLRSLSVEIPTPSKAGAMRVRLRPRQPDLVAGEEATILVVQPTT